MRNIAAATFPLFATVSNAPTDDPDQRSGVLCLNPKVPKLRPWRPWLWDPRPLPDGTEGILRSRRPEHADCIRAIEQFVPGASYSKKYLQEFETCTVEVVGEVTLEGAQLAKEASRAASAVENACTTGRGSLSFGDHTIKIGLPRESDAWKQVPAEHVREKEGEEAESEPGKQHVHEQEEQ